MSYLQYQMITLLNSLNGNNLVRVLYLNSLVLVAVIVTQQVCNVKTNLKTVIFWSTLSFSYEEEWLQIADCT